MNHLRHFLLQSRHWLLYAAAMAVLVFLLKWLQWKYVIADNASDIYIGLIALLFTLVGAWGASQLMKRKVETIIVEKTITPHDTLPDEMLQPFGLTSREMEVLNLITQGCSNAEIADKLFLSVSTVKTHVSNLFVKLDVRSRTQVIQKVNQLKIRQAGGTPTLAG
jgi:NarL family two-component system response regulator LiaR